MKYQYQLIEAFGTLQNRRARRAVTVTPDYGLMLLLADATAQ
jgi:hypothetical protein